MEKSIPRNVTIERLKANGVPFCKYPLLEKYRVRADNAGKKGDPGTALNYKKKAVELLMLLEKFDKVDAEAEFYRFSHEQLNEIAISAAEDRINNFIGVDSAKKILLNYGPNKVAASNVLNFLILKQANRLRRKGLADKANGLEKDAVSHRYSD